MVNAWICVGIFCVGILIIFKLLLGNLNQAVREQQYTTSKYQTSQKPIDFDDNTLRGMVKMNNNFLPKELNDSIRLDKLVHFPNRKVGYFYTFFNYSIHDYRLQIFTAAQKRIFRNNLMPDFKKNCANILVQTMLKAGVELIFIVHTKEGVEMIRLPFTAATCGWKS